MTALHFILPGDPATPTGGFIYDAKLIAALRRRGIEVLEKSLSDGFPEPDVEVLQQAKRVLDGIPDGAVVVIDGLAFGVMPGILHAQAERLRLVALVHHPLADETGLTEARQALLFDSERAALALAMQIVTTSRFTAGRLADYDLPKDRIAVVPPGVEPAAIANGSGGSQQNLLCVATLTPRKGHRYLLEALARLSDQPWRLTCVGSDQRDAATAEAVRRYNDKLGLGDRVRFTGALDQDALERCYQCADAVVLASRYEGFGMVLREAVARGLPVIATATGGTPEAVAREAALLVPPDDIAALAEALGRFLDDPALRDRLRQAALTARDSLPTWDQSAGLFAAALGLKPGA